MQVQPNSTIYLLAGVPIDKSYNYSLYFETEADQSNYFQTKIIPNHGMFSNQQYTRVDKNTLRVAVCSDDVLYCNYVMFKNNGTENGFPKYANKWYYAFAKVKYLNEYACEIEYEIDDIQTWMFDYVFDYCYVEREHSATDVAGDNLQPEPVDTGELVAYSKYESDFGSYIKSGVKKYPMLGAIITKRRMDDNGVLAMNGKVSPSSPLPATWEFNLTPTFMPPEYSDSSVYQHDSSSGISNGLYIYTGLLIDNEDYADFFSSNLSLYSMPNPVGSVVPSFVPTVTNPILTLGSFIQAIVDGDITSTTGSDTSEEDIVAAYQYPAGFSLKSAETTAQNVGYKKGISMYESLVATDNPYYGTYTPINNKLKISPFTKVYITSETGATGEYKFEYFAKNNSGQWKIEWNKITTYFGQPSACLVPVNYKGKERDFDNALVTSPYPTPIYSGNAFQTWWQQNKTSFITGAISNVLSVGLMGLLAKTGKYGDSSRLPTKAISAGAGLAGDVAGAIDKSNVPPNAYYQAQNEALNVGTNRIKFNVYFLGVTPEYARKIDSFFNKYGYAVNELKIPNLQRGSTKRPYWNYLKVKNCMLSPDSANNRQGIPSDVEEHLERIYENGITMWTVTNGSVNVGDYSQNNSI